MIKTYNYLGLNASRAPAAVNFPCFTVFRHHCVSYCFVVIA